MRETNYGFWCMRAVVVVVVGCTGSSEQLISTSPSTSTSEAETSVELPDISVFLTRPSDRFLVDVEEITGGHPFKGLDSAQPHAGAHVHFDNSTNRWPKGGTEPRNYPAVYAVADGTVSRVDTRFPLRGGNDRYGLDLTFAHDRTGSKCRVCYSIEPMCPEPSEGFYKSFLLVQNGQRVRKGDVIAYLYTPPNVKDSHIHFHLMFDGKKGFLAPAIFTPDIADEFHDRCRGFREHNGGSPIPPCLGHHLRAEENPFGTGARERL
jgi:hypothetical protein